MARPRRKKAPRRAAADTSSPAVAPERIQKVLARAGLGSRRALEKAIKAGEVLCNGQAAPLGASLKEGDRVQYRGRQYQVISSTQPQQTLLYNKPVGEITTRNDPEGRRTVFDRLPKPDHGRWVAIGRLDINTSGLLVLTTDGELANAMMHPASMVDREYACRIHGQVTEQQLQALRDGVELDDGPARFSDIAIAGGGESNQWYQVTLMEGRNREVRRLWATQGVEVSRLQRVRYGAAFLPKGLRRGQWHWLSAKDHQVLREDVNLPAHTPVLELQGARGAAPVRGKSSARRKKTAARSRPDNTGTLGLGPAKQARRQSTAKRPARKKTLRRGKPRGS